MGGGGGYTMRRGLSVKNFVKYPPPESGFKVNSVTIHKGQRNSGLTCQPNPKTNFTRNSARSHTSL